jgi:1-deoxy-D-xylulose-5-phosphate synthase
MTSLLKKIGSPSDLKSLKLEELPLLAQEIRETIIDVLSIKGGHLASNLGIVELTIALHYVFSSPEDKFIFDVSHQSYVHKLLTGRQDLFPRLRQFKGLCGFCSPKESPHDHFFAGHAATALSLGLGVAKTRDLTQGTEHVLPILGDASLTCGLALEALNNIPKHLKKFIVVLNDNNMSISHNVGAITNILSRMLNNPTSNRIYQELEQIIAKIPGLGPAIAEKGLRVKESLKNLVSTAPFFEQYNLNYVGPVDGHDVIKLIDVLSDLKDTTQPTILHVLTVKGKGLDNAIANPISYHGCKPFDKISGKFHAVPSSQKTFPQIFGQQMLKMADEDPLLLAVTPAMPAGSCLEEFMNRYPDRCLDVGIAEGHAVTFCGGLAYGRKTKVVASIYATFLQRALDNLFQDVCLQELPVVFAIDRGGISGPDGSTHHGIYDISFLNTMPNMVICQPRDGKLLRELLESAFSYNRPTAIRYPNMATHDSTEDLRYRELGQGEVLSEGKEIAIIALGHMCSVAMKVRDLLVEQGLEPTIIDPIYVKPLDTELFCKIASSHKAIVTLEEHSVNGGLGMIINSFLLRNGFNHLQVLNFGIPDTFLEHGSNKELSQQIGLDAASIASSLLREFHEASTDKVIC